MTKRNKSYSLILVATTEEFESIKSQTKNYKEIDLLSSRAYVFTLKNKNYLVFQGGVGKVNTSFILGQILALFDIDFIFNIGTCGSINPSLKHLDLLIATKTCFYDCDLTSFGLELGQMDDLPLYFECKNNVEKITLLCDKYNIKNGLIVCGDSFISNKNIESKSLSSFDNPLGCDMESAAVGQISFIKQIPFMIIRCVSDLASNPSNDETYDSFARKAADKSSTFFFEYID